MAGDVEGDDMRAIVAKVSRLEKLAPRPASIASWPDHELEEAMDLLKAVADGDNQRADELIAADPIFGARVLAALGELRGPGL